MFHEGMGGMSAEEWALAARGKNSGRGGGGGSFGGLWAGGFFSEGGGAEPW